MRPQMKPIGNCTPLELAALLKSGLDALLLDVRTDHERERAVIKPSLHIPLHDLPDRIDDLRAYEERPIIAYCHHGIRSLSACRILQQEGFQNLLNLEGGIDAYARETDAGIPRY